MVLFGKEFNEEEFYNTYHGRPNDMLRKACEEGYSKGVVKALELGADAVKGTLAECITRYDSYRVFFRLLWYFELDYVDFFRKYKTGDEIPSALKDDVVYTALFGLARIGLDINELFDAFYGWLFKLKNEFEKHMDVNGELQEPAFYQALKALDSNSIDSRINALYVAVRANNIAGIDYLISLGTDIRMPGTMPIDDAVACESFEAVEYCIEKGFDLFGLVKARTGPPKDKRYLFMERKLLIFFKKIVLRNNDFVIDLYRKSKTDPFVKEHLLTKEIEIKYQRLMRKEQKRQSQSFDNKKSKRWKRKWRKNKRL